MKTQITSKAFALIVGLLTQFGLYATESVSISVKTPGTLPTLISESEKYTITELTLTGQLNGTDIRFIREMAGGGLYLDGKTDGKLSILNLSGAMIVEGGDYYFNSYDGGFCATGVEWYTSDEKIGAYMFYNCSKLTSISLPSITTAIWGSAFENCTELTSITISTHVSSIADNAFSGCTSLKEIIAVPQNKNYSSIDGVLFNKDQTTLIRYPSAKEGHYSIPESVTSIEWYAFANCTGLTAVTIPNNVTAIRQYTFYNCIELTAVTIPSNVTTIEMWAFNRCAKLASVTLEEGVQTIGYSAFFCCNELTSITIPNSVTAIGQAAFGRCPKFKEYIVASDNEAYSSIDGVLFNKDKTTLIHYPQAKEGTSYTIPDKVTTIGGLAFDACGLLTSIVFSNSVATIGSSAFRACGAFKEFIVDSDNKTYSSIDGVLFSNDKTKLLLYPYAKEGAYIIPGNATAIEEYAFHSCAGITSVTIPNNVISVRDFAFAYCPELELVTISKNTTSIGMEAFAYCPKLKEVYSPNPVPSRGGYNAFYETKATLYIPVGSSDAYRTAGCWDWHFIDIIESRSISVDNATEDNFNIYIRNGALVVEGTGESIAVYNQAGVLVLSASTNSGSAEIELPQKGIYIVKTQLAGESVTKKVIW